MSRFERIQVVDSHTGGEPTRVVVAGGPDLGTGPLAERCGLLRDRHADFMSGVLLEPRGSEILVGALLVPPVDSACAAGVLFFNNVGVLAMCGHGTIGVAVTLMHLGRIGPGSHLLETPVGVVPFTVDDSGGVSLDNVPSYRLRKGVVVNVPGYGPVIGDIAWGGNWFYLVTEPVRTLDVARVDELVDFTWRIRRRLEREGITGADGAVIDHIELFGPPGDPANHARNFVLCPGKAFDRSPCGTGTSAKLACLYADGKLLPGQAWRQESIVGSVFEGSIRVVEGRILPTIRGTAHLTAEATLLFEEADPLRHGLRFASPGGA